MRKQCARLIFVGHSMGCLLGLLAEQELSIFSHMLLICCPFYIRPTWHYFQNSFLANLTKGQTDNPFIRAAWQANGVSANHAVSYLFCIRPYLELFKIIRQVRRTHPVFPIGTVFFFSELDEIVSKKSLSYAQNHLQANAGILLQSGHNYFAPKAEALLIDRMKGMFEEES